MKGRSKLYKLVFVFLLILETLWVFVMYKTIEQPSDKKMSIADEQLKECIFYDMVWEDGTIVITGRDPYLLVDCPQGIIESVTLCWQDIKGINQIACYYDTGNGYTENHKKITDHIDTDHVSLNIHQFVETVRIDFENTDEQASIQLDTILVEYADKKGGIFLAYHIFLMLFFDVLLIIKLSQQSSSWLGSFMKLIAFALLQFFTFKAYIIASGTAITIISVFELFAMVCIVFMDFGGIDCAKE